MPVAMEPQGGKPSLSLLSGEGSEPCLDSGLRSLQLLGEQEGAGRHLTLSQMVVQASHFFLGIVCKT